MITICRFVLLLACLVPTALRAHDPAQSWTEAVVHPEQVQLVITMAQSNALRLIDPANKIPQLTPANFPEHRARLTAAGGALFTLTSPKATLTATKVEVELTEENDVAYKITYPRPAPGLLIFEAAFLKKLGAGFGGVLNVSDAGGQHLGWDQLSAENASLVVMLPAPGSLPEKRK